MRTIQILITVPDGVDVKVGGSQPQAASSRPFVERPDPPYPGGACPEHGSNWKKINAGFSKTKKNADGTPKRFNAFWVCSEQGCQEKPDYESDDVVEQLPF